MTDHDSAPAPEATVTPAGDEPAAQPSGKKSGLFRRLGNGFVLFWIAFVVLGQIWLWKIWDPEHGASMQNLITVSMAMVTCLVTLFWILCLSRLKWIAAIPAALMIVVPVGALLGSIRKVDFTGDMYPVLRFRWEPTDLERLEAAPNLPVLEVVTETAEAAFPTAAPEDLAEYRGVNRDGVITGPELLQDWSDASALEIWRRPCGGGYSSFAVVDDYAITIEQRGEEEVIVCYSFEAGGERWTHTYPASFQEAAGGPGPRSTPTIHHGLVFTLGGNGDLYCLNLVDGSFVWNVNILTDNGLLWPTGEDQRQVAKWAMTSSPLIVDNLVVVNAGGPDGDGLVAYDIESGAREWQTAGLIDVQVMDGAQNRAGYSSPMLVELDGVRQIINFDGVGLWGYLPESGARLWDHAYEGQFGWRSRSSQRGTTAAARRKPSVHFSQLWPGSRHAAR